MYTLVRANVGEEPDLILRWCPVGLADVVEQDCGGCDEILGYASWVTDPIRNQDSELCMTRIQYLMALMRGQQIEGV